MSIFEFILQLQGYPIKKAKQHIAEMGSMTGEELFSYQEKQKWQIIEQHFRNTPYYTQKCNNTLPDDWNAVPIMKRKDFQQELNNIISGPFKDKRNIYINKTSGSSGTPMYFAKDKYAHAITWASIMQLYRQHNISFSDKQARFFGIPLEGLAFYKEKMKDAALNRLRFSINDLSENKILDFVSKFRTTHFTYLYGYTNSLRLFAQTLIKNKIVLKKICPTLKLAIITSEVCLSKDKELLEEGFGVPVLNEYGASELSIIAFPDQRGLWRINDKELFVEILDENNNPVKNNEKGRIIITALYNRAMPFIRYELGDYGRIETDNQGKILTSIEGRLNDTIRLPSGKVVPGLTLYYVSKALMVNMKGLKEYNIKQTAIDTIEFDVVAEDEVDTQLLEMIKQVTFTYLEPGLTVKINKVEIIKRTASGKFKHFQSYIDSPEILQPH